MLRLQDRWVWDFWFAIDGDDYHVFHLQAPRSLGDPDARHRNATTGHAVSTDLRTWRTLPDALGPGRAGRWDDLATLTGSVIAHDGRWWLFYTGVCSHDDGRIQRIGLATSTDLVTWTKDDANPLSTADSRWYERYDAAVWHEEAWRDPRVFRNPATGYFRMFLCARSRHGSPDGRGVVGHARSDDPRRHAAAAGTHHMVADDALGPFRPVPDEFLAGDRHGSRYAGKIVRDHLVFMAFLQYPDGPDDGFRGEPCDPVPVRVVDGRLVIDGR